MTVYNLTTIALSNSTLGVLVGVNNLIPWFPIMMAVALFAVIMLSIKSESISGGILVGGFFVSVMMGLFWLSGYVSFVVVVFSMLLPLIGVLLVMFTKS